MSGSMLVTQRATVVFQPRDSKGNAACLPNGVVPQWTAPDPTLADFEIAQDSMSATVTPIGPTGTLHIYVDATGFPTAVFDIVLQAAPAVTTTLILTDIEAQ